LPRLLAALRPALTARRAGRGHSRSATMRGLR
jgi:hypothetical protein